MRLIRVASVRMFGLAAVCAAAAASSAACGANTLPTAPPAPTEVAEVPDFPLAVAQDAGAVYWCAAGTLHATSLTTAVVVAPRVDCPSVSSDIALAPGRVATGGYDDVVAMDTESDVYTLVSGHSRRVARLDEGQLGDGDVYRGVVSDGTSLFYAVLRVSMSDVSRSSCSGEKATPRCRGGVEGGALYRIVGARGVRMPALEPPAIIAAGDGLIALVPPPRHWVWVGANAGPPAAPDGKVQILDSSGVHVASFQPHGVVRALSISREHAVAAVETNHRMELEWYDPQTGVRQGQLRVEGSVGSLSTSGDLTAFFTGQNPNAAKLWLLDLRTGERLLLTNTKHGGYSIGPSVFGRRVVWGEAGAGCVSGTTTCRSRLLSLVLPAAPPTIGSLRS